MKEERTCQNCKNRFVIESEDFDFYKKISVPPPTWCPECRLIRRFSFMNLWSLYKRKCSKCGKSMVSIHAEDTEFPVYCQPCWWADDWDGTEYAMEYNQNRPFLEQVRELVNKTPYMGLESAYLTNTNSDYTNGTAYSKNCYMTFWADYCENVYYSIFLFNLRDSLNCYRMKDSELCYEDVGCYKCYTTYYSEECDSCTDVWFSRSCTGCTNCFGCINLRNKSYCIFNEQYTKEKYFEKLKEFNLSSYFALENIRRKVYEFWLKYPRRAYIGNSLNVNVTGDYVYESKNSRDTYMASGVEDSRFTQFISVAKAHDSYDYTGWGNGAERIYESCVVGEGANNIKFSNECWPDVLNIEYSIYAITCKNVMGCVNLKRKEYCILNKQYTKEEYEKLSTHIREEMIRNPYVDSLGRTWKYGEFLPYELSPFTYNQTIALAFFPKNKEEILKEGIRWHEAEENEYIITIQAKDLPDSIQNTDESILKEVIACETCGKAYKILQGELDLLRRFSLPIYHHCSTCRRNALFFRTNLPRLYNRNCMKCNKQINTSYAPDRPEIVYCEQCYQAEMV